MRWCGEGDGWSKWGPDSPSCTLSMDSSISWVQRAKYFSEKVHRLVQSGTLSCYVPSLDREKHWDVWKLVNLHFKTKISHMFSKSCFGVAQGRGLLWSNDDIAMVFWICDCWGHYWCSHRSLSPYLHYWHCLAGQSDEWTREMKMFSWSRLYCRAQCPYSVKFAHCLVRQAEMLFWTQCSTSTMPHSLNAMCSLAGQKRLDHSSVQHLRHWLSRFPMISILSDARFNTRWRVR